MVEDKLVLGWREWVSLPALGIARIKAKLDSGARTSTLHALRSQPYIERGAPRVRLHIEPTRRSGGAVVVVDCAVVDERTVSDSSGHRERRLVIESPLCIAGQQWPIEITITNRDAMMFRMLLGRTAMHGRIVVDPERSYVLEKPLRQRQRKLESRV
jgi:hypothetical protein